MGFFGGILKGPVNAKQRLLHPSEIDAIYMDHFNRGWFYMPTFSGNGPQFIDDWRKEQKAKYDASIAAAGETHE